MILTSINTDSRKTCHFYYIPALFLYNGQCLNIFEFLLEWIQRKSIMHVGQRAWRKSALSPYLTYT